MLVARFGAFVLWEGQWGPGPPNQEDNQDGGPREKYFPESKSPWNGIRFTV